MEDNEVLELEAEVTESELNAFDDDWGEDSSDDGFDLTEDAQPEEGETNEESESPDSEAEKPGDEDKAGNQRFKITYLGNEEELTLEQMTELAQKGRDYDHVRQERDKLKGETGTKMAFLEDLAKRAGVSVDEQIERTRALWLVNDEYDKGNELSEEEALKRVRAEKQKAETPEEDTAPADFDDQVTEFLKLYPNVKSDEIPAEVWEMVKGGTRLLNAYQANEIKQLRSEDAKHKQEEINRKNEKRSTGSLNSAGASRQKDAFDEGWDSI